VVVVVDTLVLNFLSMRVGIDLLMKIHGELLVTEAEEYTRLRYLFDI